MTFNKKEYDQKYHKEKYARFLVDLKKKELEELNKLLLKRNLTKAQFLRNAIDTLKCKESQKGDTLKK